MLTNPTIETLKTLKLYGLLEALEEQQQTPTVQSLSFEERVALLIDRERLYRDNQRRTRLLRGARLKVGRSRRPPSRTSTTRPPAGSTSARSPSSPRGSRSAARRTCSSPGRPAQARPGSPARLRSRAAARATRCSTGGCRASSRNCASRTAMAATSSS
jgi:IstB-like ATP binding protein